MKKGYESPELLLISVSKEDMITTSPIDTEEIPLE